MDRSAATLLTIAVGALIALQAPVNAVLARSVGSRQAAFVSFLVGTIALLGIAATARGGLARLSDVGQIPSWFYLAGGLFGVAYVSVALVTVRTLGAGPVTAATIAGQLAASLVVDQLGLLGVTKTPITAVKVVGVVLLAAGTYLIVRE